MAPSKNKTSQNNKSKKKFPNAEASKAKSNVVSSEIAEPTIPVELQQLLLNIFRNAFNERLGSGIAPVLQEVKKHLYNRDFLTAFGRNDYLEAYAARWSPSRALGYVQIFDDVSKYLNPNAMEGQSSPSLQHRVVCLGGGAGAEIVALAGYQKLLENPTSEDGKDSNMSRRVDVVAIDAANWSAVVQNLQEKIVTPPPLSQYASAAAKAANEALLNPPSFNVDFHQLDVLTTDHSNLDSLVKDADVITILFTLNELYSASLAQTQNFLLNLTESVKEGTLLLVVDSPGSYSTVILNGAEKKYPMQWLLDHTLLGSGKSNEPAQWTKLESDDSRWFRLPQELRYPIELENMRYQVHLYKKRS